MIQFGKDICGNLDAASNREWLETNYLGGFASGTVSGLHTRRYHGLLTAALQPPVGRTLLLSKLEETLVIGDRRYDLSANRYGGGVIHPRGFESLRSFRLDPFPIFHYVVQDVEIEKSIFLVNHENTVVVQYLVRASKAAEAHLEIRPLIAFRDYHSTTHENSSLNRWVENRGDLAVVKPYESEPALYIAHEGGIFAPEGFWYRNFEYSVEQERGLDSSEDLFSPFGLKFELHDRYRIPIIASTEPREARNAMRYREAEIERRRSVVAMSPGADPFVQSLAAAADQFVAACRTGHTIIAGYHWFGDWGRDTMIALPGISLALGRPDLARSILLQFAQHLSQGMLPNRFPDGGEAPEYNTVDATLWLFEAVQSLNDPEFIREHLYEKLVEVIDWHVRGTRYSIRVDDDGLLLSGEPGVQLTWMDAKVGDWVVTPRHGKPVEIQALWYNALRIMQGFSQRFGFVPNANRFGVMAERARRSFLDQFWNEAEGCLYDVVGPHGVDASIRPNQVFAISLTFPLLDAARAERVLAVVERELLTSVGLRSLSPSDPNYKGRYEGDPWHRDGAYHQGTVWPWLMGPFLTAYIRVHGDSGRARAEGWLRAMESHLTEAGLGQISEIFDGDSPHAPRGCIAQAWSVAELIRVAAEDVLGIDGRFRNRTCLEASTNALVGAA